jgi:hypothetical protein
MELKKALNEKVHHQNGTGCIIHAEALTREHALKASNTAEAPSKSF